LPAQPQYGETDMHTAPVGALKQLPFAPQASLILYRQLKPAPQSASFIQDAPPEPPAPALDEPPLDEPPWFDAPPVLDPPVLDPAVLLAPPIAAAPPIAGAPPAAAPA
jgi:hypothetical protein